MRDYHIAWWNVEHLFNEANAVALGRRTDKVFRAIEDDIAGWTPQLRDRKIDQLASVIAQMNTGRFKPSCQTFADVRWSALDVGEHPGHAAEII